MTTSVVKACAIVRCFKSTDEQLRLCEVMRRTNLSKTTAHRLLASLIAGGLIERVAQNHFRCAFRLGHRSNIRIGFAAQTSATTFSRLVTASIHRAAQAHRVELIAVDNRYSPKVALRNADLLIERKVDLVLEFQTFESIAPVIASRFLQAGIPVIAIEIPHPGATYFGADNYQAGVIAGRALAKWAKINWKGDVQEVILLREKVAGLLPNSRMTGMLAGIHEICPEADRWRITDLDGKGAFAATYRSLLRYLRETPARRTLIAAHTDPSALGALKAYQDLGRSEWCAAVSHSCVLEARQELRRPGTRLIGSVAYYPEKYGDRLLPLAISIIRGNAQVPAKFMKHVFVTPGNVDRFYPHD